MSDHDHDKQHVSIQKNRQEMAEQLLAGRSLSGEQLAGDVAGKIGESSPQLALMDHIIRGNKDQYPAESIHLGGPVQISNDPNHPQEQDKESGVVNHVRHISPAWLVNNGARFNFGVRLVADVLTVMSGLRPQSRSYPRALAGAVSGTALAAGLVYDEKPMTRGEQERLNQMPVTQYVGERVKNAFDPKNHITATVGLATIPNGALYMWSGYRQHVPGKIPWEMVKGGLTVAAGAALNMIPEQEQAWQASTGIYLLRAPTSFINAWKAYFVGVPEKNIAKGDWMQLTKFSFNQSSNVFGIFYGGVKKDEQGNIIRIVDDEFRESEPDYGLPEPMIIEDHDVLNKALSGNFLSHQSVADYLHEQQVFRDSLNTQSKHQQNNNVAGAAIAVAAGAKATEAIIKKSDMPHTAIQAQQLESERLEEAPQPHLANGASST